MSRWIVLGLVAALPALAQNAAQLKPGEGRGTVETECAACHTVNYIRMNSPFLDRAGWTAEVNKMINVYGAPIPAADVPKIVGYLAEQYGTGK